MDPAKIDQALDFLEGCPKAPEFFAKLLADPKSYRSDLDDGKMVAELFLEHGTDNMSPAQKTRLKELMRPYAMFYKTYFEGAEGTERPDPKPN